MQAAEDLPLVDQTQARLHPTVFFHRSDPNMRRDSHDVVTKSHVARSLAALLGGEFAGEFNPGHRPGRAVYLVPSETITSLAEAQRLGVHSVDDLFGGVVPYPFVATKLISHALVDGAVAAPLGWSKACAERNRSAVLPGYSVFTADDARTAYELLAPMGGVRLKDPGGVGGGGQWVVKDRNDFDARLAEFDAQRLSANGLVLELDLIEPKTFSVGQVQVGDLKACYIGEQTLTRNHHGHSVYGGSSLLVTRGTLDSLLQMRLESALHTAVEQTLAYHHAAMDSYPGMFASRCNYDVIQGLDALGRCHSGVLEQSWRIGGASGAEAAALHAFRADPQLHHVRAATVEVYGDDVVVPAEAQITYSGVDAQVGRLTKYVVVDTHRETQPHVHA